MFSKAQLEAMVATVPWWWHSIDLGHGIVTPGHKGSLQVMQTELATLQLPRLLDKTVLDIGPMDGFYSFEAERRGAKRVVAVDYYSWSLDLAAHSAYMQNCHLQGHKPVADEVSPHWHPAELPGKSGYDTAHRALGSDTETVVADYLTLDPEKFGTYDVTLFLGVLYHLEDMLRGLKQVAALTREVAIIETAAIVLTDRPSTALVQFYETNELNNDMSNWWAPTMPALIGLCRAAGFRDIQVCQGPPVIQDRWWKHPPPIRHYRAVVHAFK